jgi:S-adenosylmethionine synthetase
MEGSNPNTIGIERAKRIIEDGVLQVCKDIPLSSVVVYAGIAGCASGNYADEIKSMLEKMNFATCEVGSDNNNLVAAGLADRIQLQVAYAIGKANPVSLCIDTFGTGKYSDEQILSAIKEVFDFRPYSIITQLDLRRPVYAQTAAYGHFGNPDFTWEKVDRVEELKKVINL